MNTILTDDERPKLPRPKAGSFTVVMKLDEVVARDRAIEAAVLAKLREQNPVAWRAWNDEDGYTIWADEQDAINNSAHDFDPVPLAPYAALAQLDSLGGGE